MSGTQNPEQYATLRERLQESQTEEQAHAINLQNAQPGMAGQTDYLKEVTDSGLHGHAIDVLENLTAKDLPLANLTEEQIEELKWKFRAYRELYFASHPSEHFVLDAEDQKWAYDDPDAGRVALTDVDRIDSLLSFDIAWTRTTRGEDMRQQEVMSKSINESHVKRDSKERKEGILERFSPF